MGLQIILNLHQQDDLIIDDINQLNTDLMTDIHGGFSELYGDFTSLPNFNGPFAMNGNTLQIASNWDSEFNGYANSTMVWGCYGPKIWKIIANHITQGKLVLHLDIEGNPDEYVIITAGQYEIKNASKLIF